MALTEAVQDYLEKLYWFGEAQIEPTQANLARAMNVSQPSVTEMVRRLVDDGLITRDAHRHLLFTEQGQEIAHKAVSRHRLLEAFLTEVFEIPWDEVHEEAHSLEHRLSESVERRMYAMMADATACPHGHPIGDAPREAGEPLSLVNAGSRVTLLRFENEDGDLLRLFRRAGLEPGTEYLVESATSIAVVLRPAEGGDGQSLEVPIAGTISVRVEERGTGAPASDVPGTGAQAALLGETSWGM
ncbi:MAG: DtxR family transcriptional regulator, Mn-dependent transcriptional regulator [Gaiellaceae bacterium]|nr:DtxR family transcriptional regulator, Mn-dependent transcriptional regulator [Gaiellaceae bacterium]